MSNKNKEYLFVLFSCLLCCCTPHPAVAQFGSAWRLSLIWADSVPERAEERRLERRSDPAGELLRLTERYRARGYLEMSIDSTAWTDSTRLTAWCYRGPLYVWDSLVVDSLPRDLLQAAGYRARPFGSGRPFSARDYNRLPGRLLTHLENHGYPFAQIRLQDLRIGTDYGLSGRLAVEYNELFRWGKLTVHPPEGKKRVRINRGYLSSYLGLQPGKLYDESRLSRIERRIRELPFLRTLRPPYVVFEDSTAWVHLFLDNRRASRFDVLVGLLPNDNPLTGRTRVELTGLVDIDLLNSFGAGERLHLRWQQMRAGITELELGFRYPYIAKLPLGAEARFKLYKRDSTYIDIIFDAGGQYLFGGENYLKAFWNLTTTNLISIDSQRIVNTKRLPSILDTRLSTFGLEWNHRDLDYRFNPRKGFEWNAAAGFTLRRIRPNIGILQLQDPNQPNFDFGSLYDSLDLRTYQYRFTGSYAHFIPLWKMSSAMVKLRAGWLGSPRALLGSELFRLGGNKLLRGFDEESIFARWYNVLTLEWRLIFGENSYFFVFGDLGYTRSPDGSGAYKGNIPYGFGAGVVLGTKIGLFGLSYALGAQQGNPLIVKNAKIHFGYVGLF